MVRYCEFLSKKKKEKKLTSARKNAVRRELNHFPILYSNDPSFRNLGHSFNKIFLRALLFIPTIAM